MIIRRARQEDAFQIHTIAKSLYIDRPTQDLKFGFIVYYLDEEEYAARIDSNPFYVVLVDKKVVGYIMAYNDETLRNYLKSKIVSHEERILKKLFDYCREKNIQHFTFIDQLAVSPEYQRKGYGGFLLRRLCHETEGPYFGIILNKPVLNPNENLFIRKRVNKLCDIEVESTGKWQMSKVNGKQCKFIWGLYITDNFNFKSHCSTVECTKLNS
jgi:ribosomal protein S18 acetylase RimI-like enzyme